MKIFAKARNGKMFQIGETKEEAKWYFASDVESQAAVVGVEDEVVIDAIMKNGSHYLTSITKSSEIGKIEAEAKTDTPVKEEVKPTSAPVVGGQTSSYSCEKCGASLKDGKYKTCYTCSMAARNSATTYGGKTPEIQESIKRQAIGHMTSRTLIGLQKELTLDNVEEVMERLYKKYQELVG